MTLVSLSKSLQKQEQIKHKENRKIKYRQQKLIEQK